MKMGQKHLHELLGEDQEPFLLNSYVADRCFRSDGTKPPAVKTQHVQLKKQRSTLRNSMLSGNLGKGSCFSSFPDSPDYRRTPIRFNVLRSPKSPNSVVSLHVPAKTAALLLEAALRIEKSSAPIKQARSLRGIPGFRLFGPLLKRLTSRNRTDKVKQSTGYEEKSRCACNGTSDGEGHCSSSGFESMKLSIGGIQEDDGLEPPSGLSPFRFVLQRSPHSGRHSPEITSPPTSSPVCWFSKDKGGSDPDSLTKLTVDEDEEEKEQCSPVCVLDPPFEDDDEDEDAHGQGDCSDHSVDYESSFAIVQRAKQQLLRKLYRFEKLAELDPVELEKRLLDQDSEEDDGINEPECAGFLFEEVLGRSYEEEEKIPVAPKMTKQCCSEDRQTVMRGVCKRLQLWKEADFHKIDMMVEGDLRGDHDGWIKSDQEKVGEAAKEIEVAIFGLMLQEFTEELF